MLTVNLPEDIEKYLRAAVEGGQYASIDAAVDLALRRLLQPPPPEGIMTEDELHRYMYEIGELSHIPDPSAYPDDEDDDEPIEIEGEPLSEQIIRERR